MRSVGRVLIPNDWCPYKRIGHRYTQREDHVKTQGEEGHLRTKKRGLRRNQPCQYFNLRLLASNCVKINFGGLSPSVVLLQQPQQTHTEGHLAAFVLPRSSVIPNPVTSTDHKNHVIRKLTCTMTLHSQSKNVCHNDTRFPKSIH